MIEVKGQYTDAVIYTKQPQQAAIELNDLVVPNLVGVDVGCGVLAKTSFAPSSVYRVAICLPIPFAPPVINATLLFKRPI
jgi:hypothetical protein